MASRVLLILPHRSDIRTYQFNRHLSVALAVSPAGGLQLARYSLDLVSSGLSYPLSGRAGRSVV